MVQFTLGSPALNELSNLATNTGQHLEKIFLWGPDLTAEEFQYSQDFTVKQDGKPEGRVQPLAGCNRRPGEVWILHGVWNPCGLAVCPDAARQANTA